MPREFCDREAKPVNGDSDSKLSTRPKVCLENHNIHDIQREQK
jgi:hypothetical protein